MKVIYNVMNLEKSDKHFDWLFLLYMEEYMNKSICRAFGLVLEFGIRPFNSKIRPPWSSRFVDLNTAPGRTGHNQRKCVTCDMAGKQEHKTQQVVRTSVHV